jgi:hypothetical protein
MNGTSITLTCSVTADPPRAEPMFLDPAVGGTGFIVLYLDSDLSIILPGRDQSSVAAARAIAQALVMAAEVLEKARLAPPVTNVERVIEDAQRAPHIAAVHDALDESRAADMAAGF